MIEFIGAVGKSGTILETAELKIRNFVDLNDAKQKVGMKLKSSKFYLCERQWTLLFLPRGRSDEAQDYVSVFLRNEENTKISASFTFVLVNQKNKGFDLIMKNKCSMFKAKGEVSSTLGVTKCWKRKFLTTEKSPYILNDSIIIRVEISVSFNALSPIKETLVPSLAKGLNEVFLSDLGKDVTFVIKIDTEKVEKIIAHKVVLMARSAVFKAMFTHNMLESKTNEIVISDFSPEVIKEMLHFMYTDKLQSETLDNTVYEGLLAAAIKYDIPGLVTLCETYFCGQVTVATVVDIYYLAQRCGALNLIKQTKEYIDRHEVNKNILTNMQPSSIVGKLMIAEAIVQRQRERPQQRQQHQQERSTGIVPSDLQLLFQTLPNSTTTACDNSTSKVVNEAIKEISICEFLLGVIIVLLSMLINGLLKMTQMKH